jgi:Spy/CpxP family protein refolding chaperone
LRFFALYSLDLLAIQQEDEKMSKFKTLIKTTLTLIALCLTLAIAAPAMSEKGHHQKHDGMRQILSELSLTDTQKQDIRQISKQTREDRDLFSGDVKSLKKELRSLVQTTEWDQTAIKSAMTQRQALMQQKALQRATNKNQVWNLLTQTQQAEFVTLFDTLKAGHETRKGKRKGQRLERLDLTEEQLAAVKLIKAEAKSTGEETKAKLKAFKQTERSFVQSTRFNAETWNTLISEYQADFLAMAVLKAKSHHDIWNLLTTEQQAQSEENKSKKGKHGKKGKKRQKQESI